MQLYKFFSDVHRLKAIEIYINVSKLSPRQTRYPYYISSVENVQEVAQISTKNLALIKRKSIFFSCTDG